MSQSHRKDSTTVERGQFSRNRAKAIYRCDKLNIAAIGNVVPQLHVNIVARWKSDPLWPKPVWGHAPMRAGDAVGFGRCVVAIRDRLGIAKANLVTPGQIK